MNDTRSCWAPGDQEHDHEMCVDSVAERDDPVTEYLELSTELYGLFTTLVGWSLKSGRTEVVAVRAAVRALTALGVDDSVVSAIRVRYTAGG